MGMVSGYLLDVRGRKVFIRASSRTFSIGAYLPITASLCKASPRPSYSSGLALGAVFYHMYCLHMLIPIPR